MILFGCLLAVPAFGAATPAVSSGDGALSVADGRGQIVLQARGGVIGRVDGGYGRFDSGCVSITDLTPEDLNFPQVWGDDEPQVELPRGGVKYCGQSVRFRLIGGKFRIVVSGRGIDLSAVGVGDGTIVADDLRQPGVYSLDGDDCRSPRAVCKPLPSERTAFKLGTKSITPEKSERSLFRAGLG